VNAGQFARRLARIDHQHGRSRDYRRKAFKSLLRESGAAIIIIEGKVTGWRMTNGQVVCKKRRYHSEEAALEYLGAAHANPMTKKLPCRHYACPFCGGWHLTSSPL
jgi:hypothetical protein